MYAYGRDVNHTVGVNQQSCLDTQLRNMCVICFERVGYYGMMSVKGLLVYCNWPMNCNHGKNDLVMI